MKMGNSDDFFEEFYLTENKRDSCYKKHGMHYEIYSMRQIKRSSLTVYH